MFNYDLKTLQLVIPSRSLETRKARPNSLIRNVDRESIFLPLHDCGTWHGLALMCDTDVRTHTKIILETCSTLAARLGANLPLELRAESSTND